MADEHTQDHRLNLLPTELLAQELANNLQAIDNLTLVAINDEAARLEARRQLGAVAQIIIELTTRLNKPDFRAAMGQLAEQLDRLAANTELRNDSDDAMPEPLVQSEINRRLALTIPPHLTHNNPLARLNNDKSVRRAMLASLERSEETPLLVRQAAASFDLERWEVLEMGDNVPIMMLLSSALEKRPSVVVLVVSKASLLAETSALIADLKRKLFGIKIVAVGPLLSSLSNVGMRLHADLYAPNVQQACDLAEHALSPLQTMGKPLTLDTSEMISLPDSSISLGDVVANPPPAEATDDSTNDKA